jgi:hypothetical protein
MQRLEFRPIDEFQKPDTSMLSPRSRCSIREEIENYVRNKCLGSDESEVEPLSETDKNAFDLLLKEPNAPEMLVEQFMLISPNIDSEQKFKNLAALLQSFMSRVLVLEDFQLGLAGIEIGNRIFTETMDEKEAAKVFLRLHLVGHPVWRHLLIWEKALFKSMRDELRANSPLKTMTHSEVEEYEQDVIFMRMSHLLTDYLYYGLDRDALQHIFSSYAHSQGIPEDRIRCLLNKIGSFAEKQVEESLAKRTAAEGNWLRQIERVGNSAIGYVKSYMITSPSPPETQQKKSPNKGLSLEEGKSPTKSNDSQTETTGMSAADLEEIELKKSEMEFDKLEEIIKKAEEMDDVEVIEREEEAERKLE